MKSAKLRDCGEALREARERLGVGLNELAEKLNWDRGTLSKYETERLSVTMDTVDAIAEALGQRPEVLLLFCFQSRYPNLKLKGSETGRFLEQLVEKMQVLD